MVGAGSDDLTLAATLPHLPEVFSHELSDDMVWLRIPNVKPDGYRRERHEDNAQHLGKLKAVFVVVVFVIMVVPLMRHPQEMSRFSTWYSLSAAIPSLLELPS
jgi:hypothetical protein